MDLEMRPANDATTEPDLPRWGLREVGYGVGIAILALTVIEVISVAFALQMKVNSIPFYLVDLIGSLAFEVALFAIAVTLATAADRGGILALGWRPRRPSAWLGWTAIALGVAYLALFLYIALTHISGLQWAQPQQNVPSDLFKQPITAIPAIILTVVFAPICEESFFRGFVFNGLRRRVGTEQAAVFSGLLFAVAHFQPSLIIPFTVIGVGFAYAYRKTGTLYANIAAHVAFNTVSVVATYAGGSIWLGHLWRL
jgi:membrane protease YdiL (CAAX protease family)